MSRAQLGILSIGLAFVAGLLLSMQPASSAQGGKVGPKADDLQKVLDKAVAYLNTSQGKNGEFAPKIAGPGVTAIVVAGLIRNGVSPDEPVVAKGLKYLEAHIKDDGGIHANFLMNYTTAIGLMALKEANTKGKYDAVIKKGADYIKNIQHIEDGVNRGGFGYKKGDKGDLSNSAFAQKVADDDKGGFIYNPNINDKTKGKTPEGGMRSLGGMTYGGLKSFLYAGVSKEDPRVKAAINWCRNHYTLEENPGMGKAGLYYYYHTFAKAMDALGEDLFEDAKGVKHDWRLELFEALQKRQQADGSWRNTGDKAFAEDNADLSTGFALLSLSYCKKR
jgi:squalene-hopene/tetraprenyl-beta-curcumene cyclase